MKRCKFSVSHYCSLVSFVSCLGVSADREMCPYWNKKVTEIVNTEVK